MTGDWSDPDTWGGVCPGTGGIPDSGYGAIIDPGVIVTIDIDATASSIQADNTGAPTGFIISGTNSLTVDANITLPAPSVDGTTTFNVGAGILYAESIQINGGDELKISELTVGSGIINVSGSINFEGTTENARLISTGDSTINIGGNLDFDGTLITSGTGTINFNGSGEQSMGAYDTYNNVIISNTGSTITLYNSSTISGNLEVNSGTFDTSFASDVTFSGTDKTITGTVDIAGNLNITGSITNNGTLTIDAETDSNLTGSGTLTNGANATLNINDFDGTIDLSSLVATATGSTVNYSSSGGNDRIVYPINYYNLGLLGDGEKIIETGITIENVLSIDDGVWADLSSFSYAGGLFLDGEPQVSGTWGNGTSGAENQNNDYFLGTGVVDVSNTTSAPDAPTAEAGPTIDADEESNGFDVVVPLGTSGAVAGDDIELLLDGESIVLTSGTLGTVGETIHIGSGLDDAIFDVENEEVGYSGTDACTIGLGIQDLAPGNGYTYDRFQYGWIGGPCSGGNNNVEITPGVPQTLVDGVTITFASGTGHTLLEMSPFNELWSADLTPSTPDVVFSHTLTSDDINAGYYTFTIESGMLGADGEKNLSAQILRVETIGAESDPLILTLDTSAVEEETERPRRRSSGSSASHRKIFLAKQAALSVPSITPLTRLLKYTMIGEDIRTMQKLLNQKGYTLAPSGAGAPGFETPLFGLRTLAAIKKFQKDHGLVPDGIVGPLTWGMLMK